MLLILLSKVLPWLLKTWTIIELQSYKCFEQNLLLILINTLYKKPGNTSVILKALKVVADGPFYHLILGKHYYPQKKDH